MPDITFTDNDVEEWYVQWKRGEGECGKTFEDIFQERLNEERRKKRKKLRELVKRIKND